MGVVTINGGGNNPYNAEIFIDQATVVHGDTAMGQIRVSPPFTPTQDILSRAEIGTTQLSHLLSTNEATLLDFAASVSGDGETMHRELVASAEDLLGYLGLAASSKLFAAQAD